MAEELEKEQDTEKTKENDNESLLNTVKQTRAERNKFEKQLKELQAKYKDVDPEEYRTLKTTIETKDQDVNTQLAATKTNYEKQIAERVRERDELASKYNSLRVEIAVKDAFRKNGGRSDSGDGMSYEELMLMAVKNRVRLNDKGELEIFDAAGADTLDAKGNPYTMDTLMKELRTKGATAVCFKPENDAKGGGFSQGKGVPNGMTTREYLMKLPPVERMTEARRLGVQ